MRECLDRLFALQTIDLRIQGMEREKRQIPHSISTLEQELSREEEKLRGEKAELEKLQKDRRQKEKDLEEEVEKIKKTEARVFEIKTNKEYQAVQKEIESAKKLNRQREEEILETLERIEEMQKRTARGEEELEGKRGDFQRRISDLRRKEASYEAEVADEIRQREDREKGVPAEILSRYRMLLEKRQGVAVARVAQGVCQACNMNLRPQLYIELQRQEALILCPNCNRILFWENGAAKANEP